MIKTEIVNHFQKEGYPRRTIYNTINRLHNGESIKDKKQTGRPTSWTSTRKNQLKRLTNNRKGVSQRRLGCKFGVSQMTICRQLSKMNISCFKREKTPKYTEKQAEKAKNLCNKLAHLLYRSKCCVVLDDEKYFTHDGSNMEGNDRYYTNDKSKCQDNVRFAGKEKYPDKVMVWVAICKCGISKPLIRRSKSEAVNSDIYIKECLEKRMLPFIREHHQDSNYIFWPDLASCHYSKQTVAWMDENVKFVPKDINPPNVPQARLI